MPKKRFGAEQIVTLLRQIEVSMAQGKPTPAACRDAGINHSATLPSLRTTNTFWFVQFAKKPFATEIATEPAQSLAAMRVIAGRKAASSRAAASLCIVSVTCE